MSPLRCILAIGLIAGMNSDGAAQALGVARHQNANLTDVRAADILSDSTSVLNVVDGAGDIACDVSLTKAGAVTVFTTPEIIDSREAYKRVCSQPGRVHAVADITWCGGVCSNCLACSELPGSCITVLRHDDGLEGILWAHEYGHNRGLKDVSSNFRVMNGAIQARNRHVVQTECTAFKLASTFITQAASPPVSIDDFVSQRFIHGVPFDDARTFGSSAVPRLIELLNSDSANTRANVALVLGMIGDPRAINPLMAFLQSGEGALSRNEIVAKRSAVIGLGYLYFHTRNESIFNFLAGGTDPGAWTRLVQWRSSITSTETLNRTLAEAAIHGLSLAGTAPAEKVLRDAGNRTPSIRPVVNDALRFSDDVRRLGARALSAASRPQ